MLKKMTSLTTCWPRNHHAYVNAHNECASLSVFMTDPSLSSSSKFTVTFRSKAIHC